MYPDDSLQGILAPTPWWGNNSTKDFRRGRLVKVFIPHVNQMPFTLIPIGRNEPTEHKEANVKIEPLNIRTIIRYPKLPVAALPQFDREVMTVYRAKKRPALIISEGGPKIGRTLTAGKPKWQTAPTVIVAPYYGSDEDGSRAGFTPEFVKRVRRCEYPHYMWDKLPIGGSSAESIMRLDHMQPVGRSEDAIELTEHCLNGDALELFDEWLEWLVKGVLDQDTTFGEVREELLKLP